MISRTWADAPEIDGNPFVDEGLAGRAVVSVDAKEAGEYDLWGAIS